MTTTPTPRTNPTPSPLAGFHAMSNAIGEAIRDLGSVPSGHLYAHLAGHMSLSTYQAILGDLEDRGRIKQDRSHLIRWIG